MIRRSKSESGGSVLSFTFLDVLTCTMGSLVLLVVVLGQQAKHASLEEALRHRGKPGAPKPTFVESPVLWAINTFLVHNPEEELAKLRQRNEALEKLRADAARVVAEEQARVSHLEDHERRLEQELAKLHFTLDRLKATEDRQQVDQDAADRDLKRLTALIAETEERLEKLRRESGGKKSYAIVPYKGANGTFRRPLFIECTSDAVTIQPEGIRLSPEDFDGPVRSGNPLAAAVRAAREELNARAAAAGAGDQPDPYPLLVVRPNGARAYAYALDAIEAWDADYGYEFVEADWKLEFPDPDPRLAQVMNHAVAQARQRQAMLARVAPRRYGSRLASRGEGVAGGGEGAGGGFDGFTTGGGGRIGDHAADGFLSVGSGASTTNDVAAGEARRSVAITGGGAGGRRGDGQSGSADFADQFMPGPQEKAGLGQIAASGQPPAAGTNDAAGMAGFQERGGEMADAGLAGYDSGAPGGASGGPAGVNAQTAAAAGAAGSLASAAAAGQGGAAGGANAAAAASAASAAAAGGSAANAAGPSGATVRMDLKRDSRSAAETRGANWANAAASRRATPITRPIQVIVRTDRLDVVAGEPGAGPMAVTFHQPTDRLLDELAAALQQRIKEWGLAGQGMYWRPTLVLQVAPGANRHAIRLNDLLRDSGVDVRLEMLAARPEEASHATR
jgi:hypothetical protein